MHFLTSTIGHSTSKLPPVIRMDGHLLCGSLLLEVRTMQFMQSLRHDVAFLDCLPLTPFAFLLCLATGASLSSRFRQAVKAKYAFTVCLPALEGSHDASHAVVATRCRVLRLPSFTGTFRFSISVPFFLGVWLFGVV